ncbi:SH3 domain-containing protein [Ramlibacter sp. MMS24-I3-19]|uniref:SH3 domain-containing protein n=1 Tax=Ramlibacter sp. MMS24-I3-19 TaxID=3416606 RepID=UPI003CFC1ED9
MLQRFFRGAGSAWIAALLVASALPGPARAEEEAAVVRRGSELRETPGDTGRVLAPLAADTAVTRTGERKGAWVRVRTAEGTAGWLHLFDVGPATGSGNGSGAVAGAFRSVTSLFSKPAAQRTTTSTSTIGIRGLGAEDLAQAQPDEQAVARMEALRQSDNDARQFARRAQLTPVSVEPLPEPSRVPAASTTSNVPGNPQ